MPHDEESNSDLNSWLSGIKTACSLRCGMTSDARSSPKTSFKKHSCEPSVFSIRSSARVNFYTWLYRIALNSRRDYIRNRGRTVSLETVGENSCQDSSTPSDRPDNRFKRTEEQQQVREALGRLEENHRTILILREFEGFDYQSIADTLHLNKGTVRSRLARARASLRKELTAYVSAKSVSAGSTTASLNKRFSAIVK